MDIKIKSNPNIVFPDYNHSILGTITSILKYYNVETKHKTSEKLDEILNEKKYKNVILEKSIAYSLACISMNMNTKKPPLE